MFRPASAIVAVSLALTLPVSALADKPDHAHKKGGKHKAAHKHHGGDSRHRIRTGNDPVVVISDPRDSVIHVQSGHCPPGLAKKNNGCLPPGHAKKAYGVGELIDWNRVHIVSRPGLYGLGAAPAGQRYAIVDGRLVRVDDDTGRILSILRVVEAILD